jgi:hypothetical protein
MKTDTFLSTTATQFDAKADADAIRVCEQLRFKPGLLGSEPKSVNRSWTVRKLCPELGSDPWTWGFAKNPTAQFDAIAAGASVSQPNRYVAKVTN